MGEQPLLYGRHLGLQSLAHSGIVLPWRTAPWPRLADWAWRGLAAGLPATPERTARAACRVWVCAGGRAAGPHPDCRRGPQGPLGPRPAADGIGIRRQQAIHAGLRD